MTDPNNGYWTVHDAHGKAIPLMYSIAKVKIDSKALSKIMAKTETEAKLQCTDFSPTSESMFIIYYTDEGALRVALNFTSAGKNIFFFSDFNKTDYSFIKSLKI